MGALFSRGGCQSATKNCSHSALWLRRPRSSVFHKWSALSIELHCALENRYIRYTVANQQLKPLQIRYTSVTTVTLLSISNLTQPTASQP